MKQKPYVFFLIYGSFLVIVTFLPFDTFLSRVATGVSIACIFFSFSDLLLEHHHILKKDIAIYTEKLSYLERIIENADHLDTAQELRSNIDAFRRTLTDLSISTALQAKIARALLGVGIVLLLVIPVLQSETASFFEKIGLTGTRFTILSFGIVMVNYWLQKWYSDKKSEFFCLIDNLARTLSDDTIML